MNNMKRKGIANIEIGMVLSAFLHLAVLLVFVYVFRLNSSEALPAMVKPNADYIRLTTIPKQNKNEIAANKPALKKTDKQEKLIIKNQIVDIPKPLIQEEPKKTAYLSEYSQSVKKEMVSRHKGGGYGTNVKETIELHQSAGISQNPGQTNTSPPTQSQLQEKKAKEGLSNIPAHGLSFTQQSGLPNQLQGQNQGPAQNKTNIAMNTMLPSYSRMRAIPGIGDNNYLPGLKEGDVTLLNTKSFVYAGFVRRVAYRIFDQFIFEVRNDNVSSDTITTINGYAYVEANMSKDGKLISVNLLKSSGSPTWDKLAIQACKTSAWDANPPKGAEGKDGIIHFVFAPGRDVLVVGLLE